MTIHQLVIFWRDKKARCFTAWHFQTTKTETALKRAKEILKLVNSLSDLQIYGAALDTEPILFDIKKDVPEHGIETRLIVSLSPALKSEVGGGQIKFSIPGPISALREIALKKHFSFREWQLIEQQIIPYLCSPTGIKVSVTPEHILKAEILILDREPVAPFDSSILHTKEALDAARKQYQQFQTQKLYQRVERHSERLQLLERWKEIEANCLDQINQIPMLEHSIINKVSEVIMSDLEFLLPKAPKPEEEVLWTDVPKLDFSTPSKWTHRTELKALYGLNERTYYRWINKLGVNRSLPAKEKAKISLFYKPDIEQALLNSQALRPRAIAAPSSSIGEQTPTPTQQLASLMNQMADLAAQQKVLSNALTRLESTLAEQRQADLNQINQTLSNLSQQQANITSQLPQAHMLSLMAQLVNVDKLTPTLRKLSSAITNLQPTKSKTRAKTAKSKPKGKNKNLTTKASKPKKKSRKA
jgi:hypothetical protein